MQKIFILGTILVALFLGLIYIYNVENDLVRIQHTGERAIVEPIADYEQTDSGTGSSFYVATFSFKTSDGRKIIKSRSFPSELVDDIKRNQPIVICYRPNDPENFIFEKFTPSIFLFLFIVLLFHIVAVAFKNALVELKNKRHNDNVRIIASHLERK
ncbi:MAG: hypothetical protein H7Z73_08040 [Candidatus Saccharibacteria bacterium]|nr:hypothetical protein [Moraxellaceae bacterium]